jgi:glycerophosphoryl diester phosphodiesterase
MHLRLRETARPAVGRALGPPRPWPCPMQDLTGRPGDAHEKRPRLPAAVKRIGHKGAQSLAPGNTQASFEAALAAGVDVIEFDVINKRGRLVLAHSVVAAYRRRCLLLKDGLAYLADERYAPLQFNVDLKLPGYEREVLQLLREFELAERCLVSSQFVRSLDRVRALDPRIAVGASAGMFASSSRLSPGATRIPTAANAMPAFMRTHPSQVFRSSPYPTPQISSIEPVLVIRYRTWSPDRAFSSGTSSIAADGSRWTCSGFRNDRFSTLSSFSSRRSMSVPSCDGPRAGSDALIGRLTASAGRS